MWQERIKRILIIIGAAGLTLLAVKGFSDWRLKQGVAGESIKLPTEIITRNVEELSKDVLGRAVEVLPGGSHRSASPDKTEATKIIETQTSQIIEIIKQLPEDQVKQIKKQIFKDFCEEVLRE